MPPPPRPTIDATMVNESSPLLPHPSPDGGKVVVEEPDRLTNGSGGSGGNGSGGGRRHSASAIAGANSGGGPSTSRSSGASSSLHYSSTTTAAPSPLTSPCSSYLSNLSDETPLTHNHSAATAVPNPQKKKKKPGLSNHDRSQNSLGGGGRKGGSSSSSNDALHYAASFLGPHDPLLSSPPPSSLSIHDSRSTQQGSSSSRPISARNNNYLLQSQHTHSSTWSTETSVQTRRKTLLLTSVLVLSVLMSMAVLTVGPDHTNHPPSSSPAGGGGGNNAGGDNLNQGGGKVSNRAIESADRGLDDDDDGGDDVAAADDDYGESGGGGGHKRDHERGREGTTTHNDDDDDHQRRHAHRYINRLRSDRYGRNGGGDYGANGGDGLIILPTPLRIDLVDPITGSYVNSLHNDLYDELAGAAFVVNEGDHDRDDANFGKKAERKEEKKKRRSKQQRGRGPTLKVDRTSVAFGDRLRVTWTDGRSRPLVALRQRFSANGSKGQQQQQQQHNHRDNEEGEEEVVIHRDDVIALYCPSTQTDPTKFSDAATIEQIMAMSSTTTTAITTSTSGRGKSDKDDTTGEVGGGGRWDIKSFPIIREESCEFRLWSKSKRSSTKPKEEEVTKQKEKVKQKKERPQQQLQQQQQKEGAVLGDKKYDRTDRRAGGAEERYDDGNSSDDDGIVYHLTSRSVPISLPDALPTPTAIHLSLPPSSSSSSNSMVISFTTGVTGTPVVQYGPTSQLDDDGSYGRPKLPFKSVGSSQTYTAEEMCGPPATDDGRAGRYVNPGQLHTVTLPGLMGGKTEYSYRVGVVVPRRAAWEESSSSNSDEEGVDGGDYDFDYDDDGIFWSYVHTFRTGPSSSVGSSSGSGSSSSTTTTTTTTATAESENDDEEEVFSFVVYADQGCPEDGWEYGRETMERLVGREVDFVGGGGGHHHHHRDRKNGGDSGIGRQQRQQQRSDQRRVPISFIQHLGGLSHASGAAHVWDDWFDMIGPFSTRVPLMVAVGDREYDHSARSSDNSGSRSSSATGEVREDDSDGRGGQVSKQKQQHPKQKKKKGLEISDQQRREEKAFSPGWGNFDTGSSGGECGVPTAKRFAMPASSSSTSASSSSPTANPPYWYSYDYGTLHTTVLSSEHDLSPGSVQHKWLLDDLKSVDRTKTPWLIVESHRPMYHSERGKEEDLEVGIHMRYDLEDVLVDYGVDLYLAGHYRSYLRTCDGLYRSECGNGGPVHICVGTGGARLDGTERLYDQGWTEYFSREWGYGRATVHNRTALHWEFVADVDGRTVDEVWIYKDDGGGARPGVVRL